MKILRISKNISKLSQSFQSGGASEKPIGQSDKEYNERIRSIGPGIYRVMSNLHFDGNRWDKADPNQETDIESILKYEILKVEETSGVDSGVDYGVMIINRDPRFDKMYEFDMYKDNLENLVKSGLLKEI
jgi:hypothetical protein